VRGAGVDFFSATDLYQSLGGVAQRTGGIHHVVVQDAGLALDIADDIHHFGFVGLLTALVNNGQTHMDLLREVTGAGNRANVGGDHAELVMIELVLGELLQIVLHEGGSTQQMVQRNVEEALDLGGMQVHGQHAVSAGSGDHVGNQLSGDGIAALGLAVLTGIAKVRDDSGDAAGGSTAAGIDHDQQFHQVIIDGFAGGLDQENIAATDGLFQRNGGLAVGEGLDSALAQRHPQFGADGFSKFGVGVAGENLDVVVCDHRKIPHSYFFIVPGLRRGIPLSL